jgi:ascorbate-specific PTS system EIIC-type component UlaA
MQKRAPLQFVNLAELFGSHCRNWLMMLVIIAGYLLLLLILHKITPQQTIYLTGLKGSHSRKSGLFN